MNVSCENGGICRSLVGAYRCECLNGSFTGRHCETTLSKAVLLGYFTRSVGFIMIVFLSAVAMFIVTLDVLKYAFGISLGKKRIVRVKITRERKSVAIAHHVHVNGPGSDF